MSGYRVRGIDRTEENENSEKVSADRFGYDTGGGYGVRASAKELSVHARAEEICRERWGKYPGLDGYTAEQYTVAYAAAEEEAALKVAV